MVAGGRAIYGSQRFRPEESPRIKTTNARRQNNMAVDVLENLLELEDGLLRRHFFVEQR